MQWNPELSFISSYYPLILLACEQSQDGTKIWQTGVWSIIVLTDLLLNVFLGRQMQTLTDSSALWLASIVRPFRGSWNETGPQGSLLHWSMADGFLAHSVCWCTRRVVVVALFELLNDILLQSYFLCINCSPFDVLNLRFSFSFQCSLTVNGFFQKWKPLTLTAFAGSLWRYSLKTSKPRKNVHLKISKALCGIIQVVFIVSKAQYFQYRKEGFIIQAPKLHV